MLALPPSNRLLPPYESAPSVSRIDITAPASSAQNRSLRVSLNSVKERGRVNKSTRLYALVSPRDVAKLYVLPSSPPMDEFAVANVAASAALALVHVELRFSRGRRLAARQSS